MKTLGIILIVVGILTFAIPYIPFTKEEKVLDVGPIEAYKSEKQTIPLSPIVGVITTVAGIVVLVVAKRK